MVVKIMNKVKGKERMHKDPNNCCKCGEKLKGVNHRRTTPKMCPSCRGDQVGGNSVIRQIYLDAQDNPTEPAEDEMFFEDDPRAEEEIMYGRVKRQPSVLSYGVSELADIMVPSLTNPAYKHKKGSARNGTRFSIKKEHEQ